MVTSDARFRGPIKTLFRQSLQAQPGFSIPLPQRLHRQYQHHSPVAHLTASSCVAMECVEAGELDVNASFIYAPLSQPESTRILLVAPSKTKDSQLLCNLVHINLSDCELGTVCHYTALSYVWGDGAKLETISVNGLPCKVTVNLHSALLDLRDPTWTLWLWVDAVCIDQGNSQERASQVALMGTIYSAATRTIIYLGSPLKRLTGGEISSDPAVSELHLASPWFGRVWVFQELVFSKCPLVQYGSQRWAWNSFVDSADVVTKKLEMYGHALGRPADFTAIDARIDNRFPPDVLKLARDGGKRLREMQQARKWYMQGTRIGFSMFDLLKARRGCGVTDPRDMIFAHVGFASNRGVDADYMLTAEELFEDITRRFITSEGLHEILSLVPCDKSTSGRRLKLASWIPDWTSPARPIFPPLPGCIAHNAYYSDGAFDLYSSKRSRARTSALTMDISCMTRPRSAQLVVFGIFCDRIARCSSKLTTDRPPHPITRSCTTVYLNPAETLLALPAEDTPEEEIGYDAIRRLFSQNGSFLPALVSGKMPAFDEQGNKVMNLHGTLQFFHACGHAGVAKDIGEGARLARLSSGGLAFIPVDARVGDFLVHLADDRRGSRRQPTYICRIPGFNQDVLLLKKKLSKCLRDVFTYHKRCIDYGDIETFLPLLPEDFVIFCELVGTCSARTEWQDRSDDLDTTKPFAFMIK